MVFHHVGGKFLAERNASRNNLKQAIQGGGLDKGRVTAKIEVKILALQKKGGG